MSTDEGAARMARGIELLLAADRIMGEAAAELVAAQELVDVTDMSESYKEAYLGLLMAALEQQQVFQDAFARVLVSLRAAHALIAYPDGGEEMSHILDEGSKALGLDHKPLNRQQRRRQERARRN